MADKKTSKETMELFTGSLDGLEHMTGRKYEAIKIDGKLVEVTGSGYINNPLKGPDVNSVLRGMAWGKGADAVVELTYVPIEMVLKEFDNLDGRIKDVIFLARGYCVKDITEIRTG